VTNPNPLTQIELPIPFDRILAAHVQPAVAELLQRARATIDAIATAPGERTFENTMSALDECAEDLGYAISVVRHLEAVVSSPELRAAYNSVQPDVTAFYASIPLNEALWKALRAYEETGEARQLEGVRRRFLEKTIDSFRRHGAELDPAGKKRMEEIDIELGAITTKFAQNVLDETAAFEHIVTEESSLAGLPPSALAAARQSAEQKGVAGWRFTLQQPSYLAVMTYLDDAAVREKFYRAYNRRASSGDRDNSTLVARILELRREKARLLGFETFADLVLADRMAKNGSAAQTFVRDLTERTRAAFERENHALQAFRDRLEGAKSRPLAPWDLAYYAEKQRQAEYQFEEEDLRPYFPLEQVVAGMFELVKRLYGIEVRETGGVPVWHPDVKYYEVYDEDGSLLGGFYSDWYPRETKRGGAWMDAFLTGHPDGSGWTPHIGLICGNLTPPVDGKPALLSHRDVETIFHEFGHLLHHILSRVEIRTLAGTAVAWDFVELPSQIMENWCWERESLDLFARHWQTGHPLPEELFQKMKRARAFRAANAQMRQLGFAALDLALHIDYDPVRDGAALDYARNILQQYMPAPPPPDFAMIAAFTHLFADPVGYGAGYYSYKWAEVLDADAFTRFRTAGVFSAEVGRDFRQFILSRGNSEEPAELYRRFMRRNPDPNALLERLGLLARV